MADLEKIDEKTFRVNVGYETIYVDKLYGPTAFSTLEIRADSSSGDWLINCRERLMCRIPGQMPEDYVGSVHLGGLERECNNCGWRLPDGIESYAGPCPQCIGELQESFRQLGFELMPIKATEPMRQVFYSTVSGFGDDYMLPEQADALWKRLIEARNKA
jgi:hypothetical protein